MKALALIKFGIVGAVLILAAACSREMVDGAAEGDNASRIPGGVVNVYSGRHYDSDLELFAAFTQETGIKVNLIEAQGDALIERLVSEGAASPADLFITADAGMLWRAQSRGLLRPITDKDVLARVAAQYRHTDGEWIGLSKRARVILYNREQGLPEGLSTYEDLANTDYRGMICIRSSSNIYNQSLLASLIAHHGVDAAERWARGVVENFARTPQGNDTSQIEAVAAGLCRVAVVNSYYVARFLNPSDADAYAIGQKVSVLFPNQDGRGAHINISGAGVTAYAANATNAEALIEFLLREGSQVAFAQGNNEYPVVEGVEPVGPIASLGTFHGDTLDAVMYGEHQAEAVKIFDRVGWR